MKDIRSWHPGFIDLHDVEYAANDDFMAKRFAEFAASHFGLERALISNGMQAHAGVTFRKHATRVAVHPEASSGDKRWLANRFVELARRLRAADFSVEFTMLARERPCWVRDVSDVAPLRIFPSTAALAEWLYESGWFVGNDSGVGHLASSLGIPTLTVFRRRRIAGRWRPGFAAGAIVVPPWWVPTAALKERWWRESISVRRVFAAFHRLRSCSFRLDNRLWRDTGREAMNAMLQRAGSIAVVMSSAIGDTLLTMVLVNNLVRNGFRPMVVGRVMEDLAPWFPGIDVRRASEMPPQVDLVIQLHATATGRALSADGELCEISRLDAFRRTEHMIDRLVAVARDTFGLANVTRDTGIVAPEGVRPGRACRTCRGASDRQP